MTLDEALCYLAACALALAIALSGEDCRQYTEGTDSYHQCMTGEEIDLSIQDEIDEPRSQGRD